MSVVLPIGVAEEGNDGYELTLTIASDYVLKAETNTYLKEIIAYTLDLGFSRFAGAIRGDSEKGVKTFFFSKPDYFDKDDMLVNDFEIKQKVDLLMRNEFKL